MNIQFSGVEGITESCINAVLRHLQFGDHVSKVLILTYQSSHALVLYIEEEIIVVKAGFSSGYIGEGPKGFAVILSILKEHGTEIEEYDVGKKTIEKLNYSNLTQSELEKIINSKPVRPTRWFDYVYDFKDKGLNKDDLLKKFPFVIPYAIIDHRILDLAITFWDYPGDKILRGYRRLEDTLRKRCDIDEHGSKLFEKSFLGEKSVLYWPNLNKNEAANRANLFKATFGAFRNRRAHKEIEEDQISQLNEFIMLNHLFLLEAESIFRPEDRDPVVSVDSQKRTDH
ncbi:TIGR02391 family protein [Desulfopila inferna]|uniref:TIGR02391 family protein n=1 Tax=Desulfopila inferna TaxID=468528 RepID=UPI00196486E1|nr:TIGR02391 family protein [Desulfopila inferna]MBM9604108.1 hypothetical protein [Desulfopila inferna]